MDLFNFILGKLNRHSLVFHYLRIGSASPLLDDLREASEELQIEWVQHEVDYFGDYFFGSTYAEYDAALINLGINDENAAIMRRGFWEDFIWKTKGMELPIAIVIPDTNSFGSLTQGMVMEALSLVRLTDRPVEIFENTTDEISRIIDFLSGVASIVHRKEHPEEDEEKLDD
jgi:hypothetical protein